MPLHHHSRGDFLVFRTGLVTNAATWHLSVLRRNCTIDICHGQAITDQFGRVNPYTHRAFGSEHLDAANAGDTADFIIDVARGVVGQADRILVPLLVCQGVDQQEVGAGLLDLQSLLHDCLRQT